MSSQIGKLAVTTGPEATSSPGDPPDEGETQTETISGMTPMTKTTAHLIEVGTGETEEAVAHPPVVPEEQEVVAIVVANVSGLVVETDDVLAIGPARNAVNTARAGTVRTLGATPRPMRRKRKTSGQP